MVKKTTSLTIDNEILDKMKDKGFNMSDVAEKAMRKKLGEVVLRPTEEKCKFCGKEVKLADAKNPGVGMMWLFPSEQWVCRQCLENKKRDVVNSTY